MKPARSKHSEAVIKRKIEQIITEEYDTHRRGLSLIIDAIEFSGRPTKHIRIWGTLHLTKVGSPFCCMEPICMFSDKGRRRQVCAALKKALGVTNPIQLDLDRINPHVHDGVAFKDHSEYPPYSG